MTLPHVNSIGICITILSSTYTVDLSNCFNTWLDGSQNQALIDFIAAIPTDGRMAILGVNDEGSRYLGAAAMTAIQTEFQSSFISTLMWRESWLLIGAKGQAPTIEQRGGYVPAPPVVYAECPNPGPYLGAYGGFPTLP